MQSSPNMQGFALPDTIDPPDTVCYKINVPNDPAHIQAFFGVLYDLTLWVSWQRDSLHRGAQAAAVWKKIWNDLLIAGNCDCAIPIAESDYEMSICEQLRFQNGVLQALCCGEWVPISGQPSQGIGAPGQPGDGSGQPSAGTCQTYHAEMVASDQWLCPAVVNAGDTIQISAQQGAWNDGSVNWYCPTGQQFFAGHCTASTSLNGGDPLPTQPHMALLTKIAGVYHNISDGVLFTVPGGVSNALLILQANDASLGDNSGQIAYDITVCNNQPATWSHLLNFRTAPHGTSGNSSVWTPGIGLQNLTVSAGVYSIRWFVDLPTSTTLTAVEPVYTNTDVAGDTNNLVVAQDSGGSTITAYNDTISSHGSVTDRDVYLPGAAAGTRHIEIALDSHNNAGNVAQLTVYGSGPEPVWP